MSGMDKLREEAATRQGWLCAYCNIRLPDDPAMFDLGHDTSKSAVTRGEAEQIEVNVTNLDGSLSDNAIAIHNQQVLPCNQSQGVSTLKDSDRELNFSNYSIVRLLVDERTRSQKARLAWENRVRAATRLDHGEMVAMATGFADQYREIEKNMTKQLRLGVKALMDESPILWAAVQIPGISEVLAARIFADIDFYMAKHASSLHRFAGYGVIDGKREGSVEGEPRHMNKRVKIAMRNAVESWIKLGPTKSKYAAFYYARRLKTENDPEWSQRKKGHRHNDAIGVTAKLFLSHAWEIGRELAGLSITGPYVHVDRSNPGYISPQAFGWPTIDEIRDATNGN
ncbi:MAG: hypothetical protein K940chlam2_01058 [Chlamydiae bacterium]|nr:hypothetical protein [Chlamydiota bacterium]